MFLENPQSQICERLKVGTNIRIAVAYWGKGAIERLGIKELKRRDIKIVCDLLSGACNPDEVQELRDVLGRERVRKLSRLHAKVWIFDNCAVVGSSNASTNGLAQEGCEADGLIEANVLIDDEPRISKISDWYENKVWRFASEITDTDLKTAQRKWKERFKKRPLPEQDTLLKALQANPSAMDGRDVWVCAWPWEDLDKTGKAALRDVQKDRENDNIFCWDVTDYKNANFPPAGSYVIEFDLHSSGSKSLQLSQILQDDPKVSQRGRMLLLRKAVKKIGDLPLGKSAVWAKAIERFKSSRPGERYLDEVGKFYREFLESSLASANMLTRMPVAITPPDSPAA
jgi:hypothetical protein